MFDHVKSARVIMRRARPRPSLPGVRGPGITQTTTPHLSSARTGTASKLFATNLVDYSE